MISRVVRLFLVVGGLFTVAVVRPGDAAPVVDSFAGLPPDSSRVAATFLCDGEEPSVSPDGRSVAFFRLGALRVIDVATRGERVLGYISNAHAVSWSPRGERLVFQGDDSLVTRGKFWLWTVRSDGGDLRRLRGSGPRDQYPLWTRDGTRVVTSRGGGLSVIDSNGVGAVAVAARPAHDSFMLACGWIGTGDSLLCAVAEGASEYRLYLASLSQGEARPDPAAAGVDPYLAQDVSTYAQGAVIAVGMGNSIALSERVKGGRVRRYWWAEPAQARKVSVSKDESFAVFQDTTDPESTGLWVVRLRVARAH